jgi:predicted RNA binding protein YcfA (HicA-like mRNA interferase family)
MPKLPSSKTVIKILEKEGFIFVSQRGSHAKYRKDSATVIVPSPKKEIPFGTFKSIVRQSKLSPEKFTK